MYELYDPCTVMFFYRCAFTTSPPSEDRRTHSSRNKHIMIDLGTGNNNKMYETFPCIEVIVLIDNTPRNWPMDNKQEVHVSFTRDYVKLMCF